MSYIKSLLINFFSIFFVDYLFPGILITAYSRIPRIEGDIIFAVCLAVINSLIFPILKLFRVYIKFWKILIFSFLINFICYGIINLLPAGVKVVSLLGYLIASFVVFLISLFTNYFIFKKTFLKDDLKEEMIEEDDDIEHD